MACAAAPATTVAQDDYKLVFEDQFDGDSVRRNSWHTYINWAGMESENWGGSRSDKNLRVLYLDNNVQVGSGICTLSLRREDASWTCDTCKYDHWTRKYTSGGLYSYYTQPYAYGRFEARLRMPVAKGLHATFWLWPAEADKDVPEFDIAESYGGKLWPVPFPQYSDRFTNFSVHRWGPSGHAEKKGRYPRQHWLDFLRGKHFRQEEWHVYRMDWEPDTLHFYLDGKLIQQYNRYSRKNGGVGQGSVTVRNSDASTTPFWFPPTTLGCNIRLTLGLDDDDDRPAGEVGTMLIDYVRVWQR